jgi:exodeoxyribonuclease VII large subunit
MATERALSERRYKLQILEKRMGSPESLIQRKVKELEYLTQRMNKGVAVSIERKKALWTKWCSVLDSMSPLKVVERGYSIVKKDNEVVKSSDQVKTGDQVQITLAHGQLEARIEKVIK